MHRTIPTKSHTENDDQDQNSYSPLVFHVEGWACKKPTYISLPFKGDSVAQIITRRLTTGVEKTNAAKLFIHLSSRSLFYNQFLCILVNVFLWNILHRTYYKSTRTPFFLDEQTTNKEKITVLFSINWLHSTVVLTSNNLFTLFFAYQTINPDQLNVVC